MYSMVVKFNIIFKQKNHIKTDMVTLFYVKYSKLCSMRYCNFNLYKRDIRATGEGSQFIHL